MRLLASTLCALALWAPSAMAQPGPPSPPEPPPAPQWARYTSATEVQIRDLAGFVRVIPENRTDVAVSVANPGPLTAPELRVSGNRLIIDGKLRRQIRSCRILDRGGLEVTTRREGRLGPTQLTTIELRVPQAAVVSAGGAVRMNVGRSQSMRLALDGCGDADVEAVAGEADIALAGAPELRLYEAGSARLAIAGAGDVVVGVVRDGLTVSIAGAGDLTVSRADGPTNIAIQGAGDVTIRDGRASVLAVAIAGAGDVTHNGVAERLNASIFGAGDVQVRHVEGEVSRRVIGIGEVRVGS